MHNRKAVVVSHAIMAEGVVVVGVECPNGCRAGRGGTRPQIHTHGWTRPAGEDGGERAPHCLDDDAAPYTLHWPGGAPAEVAAALRGAGHAA